MKPQTKNGCSTPLLMATGSLVTFGELNISFFHKKLNKYVYNKNYLHMKNFHIVGVKLSKFVSHSLFA